MKDGSAMAFGRGYEGQLGLGCNIDDDGCWGGDQLTPMAITDLGNNIKACVVGNANTALI
jgi:hypothetical protein